MRPRRRPPLPHVVSIFQWHVGTNNPPSCKWNTFIAAGQGDGCEWRIVSQEAIFLWLRRREHFLHLPCVLYRRFCSNGCSKETCSNGSNGSGGSSSSSGSGSNSSSGSSSSSGSNDSNDSNSNRYTASGGCEPELQNRMALKSLYYRNHTYARMSRHRNVKPQYYNKIQNTNTNTIQSIKHFKASRSHTTQKKHVPNSTLEQFEKLIVFDPLTYNFSLNGAFTAAINAAEAEEQREHQNVGQAAGVRNAGVGGAARG